MELQEIINNLNRSRILIADYADIRESIWQNHWFIKNYNRKRLFNRIALLGTALLTYLFVNGSNLSRNLIPALTMAPLFFLFFRFGIGDILDYFKRKTLARQINPVIVQKTDEMNSLAEQLDRFTVLPEKYRSLQAIDAIKGYFANGRADTLKEAYNLFEDELYKFQQLRNQQYQINQGTMIIAQNYKMIQQNKKMINAQRVTNNLLLWK